MELISILGLVFAAAVLAIILKQYKAEYSVAVVTAVGVIILTQFILYIVEPIWNLRDMIIESGINSAYFGISFKALGICLVTGFISDICRDFGQTALGNFAIMAGKCAIFVISVPILTELLSAAYSFIGK